MCRPKCKIERNMQLTPGELHGVALIFDLGLEGFSVVALDKDNAVLHGPAGAAAPACVTGIAPAASWDSTMSACSVMFLASVTTSSGF